ncbi:MAG: YgiT-type zinc finger protein [Desulfobacteraceae bacterium]|nr:MAG: YgiT-type zinc finger protein [Desulfobacteraceae bacterium]
MTPSRSSRIRGCGLAPSTVTFLVPGWVCLHCGERLYSKDTVRCFERIREKRKQDDITGFQPMGQSFRVGNCDLESLG